MDVAVVLQAQVGPLGHTLRRQAFLCPGQLLGGQGHARHLRTKFLRGFFGQSAPAAADFQYPVTTPNARHVQCTSHLGILGLLHVLRCVAAEPGR